MGNDSKPLNDPGAPAGSDGRGGAREISSASLFGQASLVLIRHEGTIYTLRRTRNGKLILTK